MTRRDKCAEIIETAREACKARGYGFSDTFAALYGFGVVHEGEEFALTVRRYWGPRPPANTVLCEKCGDTVK